MTKQGAVNTVAINIPERLGSGKFSYADAVHEVAARGIDKWHSELAEAKIVYLFKDADSWTSKGKTVLARTYKVPEQWQFLSGYDILVVVNYLAWCSLNAMQQEALIDHELCHILKEEDKNGYPKWSLVDHDVEEFAAVVQRHGLWMPDIEQFMNAAKQMTLDV